MPLERAAEASTYNPDSDRLQRLPFTGGRRLRRGPVDCGRARDSTEQRSSRKHALMVFFHLFPPSVFRRGVAQRLWIADNPAANDFIDLAGVADIGKRIAVQNHEVGQFALFDGSELVSLPQSTGILDRG